MGLVDELGSKRSGRISALTTLVEAALALYRGETRIAALLLGAAALAYRWSAVGIVAELLIKLYQYLR
jgi:hypothetical protein